MRVFFVLFWVVACFASPVTTYAADGKLVKVDSKRGVKQPFLFIKPDNAKAGVVLFVGGDGLLKLSSSGKINEQKNNFFSRTYEKFAEAGLMVALVDVPSDKKKIMVCFVSAHNMRAISSPLSII